MYGVIAIYPHSHRHKSKCSESERISVKNTHSPVVEENFCSCKSSDELNWKKKYIITEPSEKLCIVFDGFISGVLNYKQ